MRTMTPVKKAAAATVTGLTALALLGGCGSLNEGNATSGDLKGVPAVKPDKIEAYNNVDGHPNMVRLCIGKVAFLTTSRDAGNNLIRVPEWDVPFCGGVESKWMPAATGAQADPRPAPAAS